MHKSLIAIAAITASFARSPRPLHSKLEVFDLATKSAATVYRADGIFEAPNWSPDGKYLL